MAAVSTVLPDPAFAPSLSLMEITTRPDILFVSGRGSWLTDHAGKRYLDFVQGWAVNALGHCSPRVTGALVYQASRLINCSPAFYNEPMMRLADKLAVHSGLDKVFFANSGAEANEGAIKLARKWGAARKNGATRIVTLEHGFHGRTLACMSASGKPQWDKLFAPKVDGFVKVPLNDLAALEAALTDEVVAVMLEPIQGEAGVFSATDKYLKELRALCTARGVLLILDEVQTGIGRTGKMFACQWPGIVPDIMTLGKGLGGGVPLAALLAQDEVCCFEAGDQGGTFNGNPLMTAVGCAVVDEIAKPGFLKGIDDRSVQLAGGLRRLAVKHTLGDVRGRGLLLALGLPKGNAAAVVDRAREMGLLLNAPRPDALRFMPALNVSAGEVERALAILDRALA
ncbi:MAG: acetylornithine transaminase [Rhodospirillaceae bacterium]|nr:acetylornithine transaminase [Rhodospirillaceae bacterium]